MARLLWKLYVASRGMLAIVYAYILICSRLAMIGIYFEIAHYMGTAFMIAGQYRVLS